MTNEINILLVDDIDEVRENVKKLLSFEQDFRVIGSTGSGREGVTLARQLKPDVVIMDINMPDMDGIQATSMITKAVPTAAVVMMSVNNDADYMRRAMMAGARNFLNKPVSMDDLYHTIRTVYKEYEPLRRSYEQMAQMPMDGTRPGAGPSAGSRAGNVLVFYGPKGGVGTTTLAVNTAAALVSEDTKVLLVDADGQYSDVSLFLNLKSPNTILDTLDTVEDFDADYFDSVAVAHGSGLKVLTGVPNPEEGKRLAANPQAVAELIRHVAPRYDYVVVDTSSYLDGDHVNAELFNVATRIVLVGTPTLSSVVAFRYLLDQFSQLYPNDKIMLVLNKVLEERGRQRATIATDAIVKHLKMPVDAEIPSNERAFLGAVTRGVPVITVERDVNRSPTREFVALAALLKKRLGTQPDDDDAPGAPKRTPFRLGGR